MHHDLLQDLAIIMLVAGVVTIIFRQLRQPVVLGYILAGVIIGPYTPPYALVQDEGVIKTLAELGVILLLFSLGLRFSLRNLARVGAVASIAALLEILLMITVGYVIGRAFGWSTMDGIFLGAILSVSSTTIIMKALEDLGKTKDRFAEITFGILIVDDIASIIILALLSGIAMTGGLSATELLGTLTQLAAFLAVVLLAGLILVPRLFRYLSRFKSNEMMLVALLGLCFGVSLLALKLGYSVALGAFLIGAVVGESREGPRAAELIEPVRDMFSAVFFVTVGMLIQPALLLEYALPIAVVAAAVIVGKILACSFGAFLGGSDGRTALQVGMSLAPIGEFSFIIAALGESLNVTSHFLYPIVVTVSALTTLTTPYLIRHSNAVASGIRGITPDFIAQSARLYTRLKPIASVAEGRNAIIRKVVRRSLLQIALNILLIGGMFILARALERGGSAWLPPLPEWMGGPKTLLWFAAVIGALPLCVAVVRKLQALSMIVAEASIGARVGGERKYALRSLLTSVLMVILSLLFAAAVLMMSSALLPPLPVLIALLFVLGFITFRMWGHFVRVYARAQVALRTTFEQGDDGAAAHPLPAILRNAEVFVVEVEPGSAGARRMIRELGVRSRTGASIVGIERGGQAIMNPSAHEELLPGDRLLLLGNTEQLAAAAALFTTARDAS